jgi:hypothetical protein
MAIATNESGPQGMTSHVADQPHAGIGLALVRMSQRTAQKFSLEMGLDGNY